MMIYVIYDLRCGDNIEPSESRLQISSPRARLSGWPSNHHVQENHDYGQKCQLQAARLTSRPGWSAWGVGREPVHDFAGQGLLMFRRSCVCVILIVIMTLNKLIVMTMKMCLKVKARAKELMKEAEKCRKEAKVAFHTQFSSPLLLRP